METEGEILCACLTSAHANEKILACLQSVLLFFLEGWLGILRGI